MDTIQYTQEHFNEDMQRVIDKIGDRRFDLIIGVNRGGCLPAVCLSHALGIPATMIDYSTRDGVNIHPKSLYSYFEEISGRYKQVLIVDDLIDSGISMIKLLQTARMFCDVSVATLLHNTEVQLKVDHYWGTGYSRDHEKRYFDFWWEMYDKAAKSATD